MLALIAANASVYLLIAVRCFALVMTLPLLSMRSVSRVAKVALAGYMAFLVLPMATSAEWDGIAGTFGSFTLEYVFLLIGEALIGIITGFYITIIFSAFSSAGQFFTFQMGFGASEVYDALSQVENPLMGQYLNLIAMLLFLQVQGFQRIFLSGVLRSFQSINCYALVHAQDSFYTFLLSGLTDLFFDALMIALPLIAALLLVSICMGILSKAAPQMNLLSEGLPITILAAFFLLTLLLPTMCDFFVRSFSIGFAKLEQLFAEVGTVMGTFLPSGE